MPYSCKVGAFGMVFHLILLDYHLLKGEERNRNTCDGGLYAKNKLPSIPEISNISDHVCHTSSDVCRMCCAGTLLLMVLKV